MGKPMPGSRHSARQLESTRLQLDLRHWLKPFVYDMRLFDCILVGHCKWGCPFPARVKLTEHRTVGIQCCLSIHYFLFYSLKVVNPHLNQWIIITLTCVFKIHQTFRRLSGTTVDCLVTVVNFCETSYSTHSISSITFILLCCFVHTVW